MSGKASKTGRIQFKTVEDNGTSPAEDIIKQRLAAEVAAVAAETKPEDLNNIIQTKGTTKANQREQYLIVLNRVFKQTTTTNKSLLNVMLYLHWIFCHEVIGSLFLAIIYFGITMKTGGFDPSVSLLGVIIRAYICSRAWRAIAGFLDKGFFDIVKHFVIMICDYFFYHAKPSTMKYRVFTWLFASVCSTGAFVLGAYLIDIYDDQTVASAFTQIPTTNYLTFFFESFFVLIIYYIHVKTYIASHSAESIAASQEINDNPDLLKADMLTKHIGEVSVGSVVKSCLNGALHIASLKHDKDGQSLDQIANIQMCAMIILQYVSHSFLNFNAILGYCIYFKSSWTNVWVQLLSHVIAATLVIFYACHESRRRCKLDEAIRAGMISAGHQYKSTFKNN